MSAALAVSNPADNHQVGYRLQRLTPLTNGASTAKDGNRKSDACSIDSEVMHVKAYSYVVGETVSVVGEAGMRPVELEGGTDGPLWIKCVNKEVPSMPIIPAEDPVILVKDCSTMMQDDQERRLNHADCIDQLEMSKAKTKENSGKRQRAWAKMQEKKVREKLADCPPELVEECFSKEMTEDEMRKCLRAVLEHCSGAELPDLAARVGTGLLLRERVVRATLKHEKWVEDGWKHWEARSTDARR